MSQFPLSVIILTRDEAKNIAACIAHLTWADEIILIDSFSQDETLVFAKSARPDIRIFQNEFHDFGQQRNWALDQTSPKRPWVLFVDADERITDECAAAIRQAVADPKDRVGFFLCYRNIFLGRWIRHCSHFPSWQLRLLKRGAVRFQKEGHGQREVTEGKLEYIQAPFDHLDLSKGMTEWVAKHNQYSSQEIELLVRLGSEPLRLRELLGDAIQRRRFLKTLAARLGSNPILWLIYVYLLRGGFLDGRAGWTFCQLRFAQQIQVKAKLIETRSHVSAIEFHDRLADRWEQKYSRRSFISRQRTLEQCLLATDLRGQRWLDAGCGSGRLARLLASRGCTVVGVDASLRMIEQARLNDATGVVSFQRIAGIETMDVESASLDGVLCLSVLEYLENPEAALARFSSALRPGGALVISVPNRSSLLRRGLCMSHSLTRWPAYLRFSRNEYRADDFGKVLESHGLRVESQVYLGGPLPQSVQKSASFGSLMMFVARKAA